LFIVLALLTAALVFAGVAARPPVAAAGGVGKWTNLSGATGSSLTQVGLVHCLQNRFTPSDLLKDGIG
jgi:hypothetical protein